MIDFCFMYAAKAGETASVAAWFITDGNERRRLVDYLLDKGYNLQIVKTERGFKECGIELPEEQKRLANELLEDCNEHSRFRNYYRNNWITWCVDHLRGL